MGSGYEAAAIATTGVVRNTMIEAATSVIQTAMRNSGYSPPATQTASEVEEFVKLAVLGCYWEMVAKIPEASIPLPENWPTHPAKLAYASILSGDAKLAATPSDIGAVGGFAWTENDPDVDDSRPPRATREELEGW